MSVGDFFGKLAVALSLQAIKEAWAQRQKQRAHRTRRRRPAIRKKKPMNWQARRDSRRRMARLSRRRNRGQHGRTTRPAR